MTYEFIKAAALQTLFDKTEDMIWVKDLNLVYVAASMPFVRMTGKDSLEEVIGKTAFDVFEEDLAARYTSDDMEMLAEKMDQLDYEEPLAPDQGKARYSATTKYILRDGEGNAVGIMGISRDITETTLKTEELLQVVGTDELTGVLNRAYTVKAIRSFLAGPGKSETHALLMIDIDNFKAINDTLGHQQGDTVLASCANAIRDSFRDSDIVGRVGGDEFFVLMKNVPDVEVVKKKSDLLLEAFRNVVEKEFPWKVSGSIGISLYEGNGISLEELYRQADRALYDAKRKGKDQFAFYKDLLAR